LHRIALPVVSEWCQDGAHWFHCCPSLIVFLSSPFPAMGCGISMPYLAATSTIPPRLAGPHRRAACHHRRRAYPPPRRSARTSLPVSGLPASCPLPCRPGVPTSGVGASRELRRLRSSSCPYSPNVGEEGVFSEVRGRERESRPSASCPTASPRPSRRY
jgi:hypothetical protein